MIKARHIPHYIIESRNLFNSKLTEKMSKEVVDILSKYKYDTTHVFTLDAFNVVFEKTHYKWALLKHAALTSTMMACFVAYIHNFCYFVIDPFLFWKSYMPHNATTSLLNYVNILQNLQKLKGVYIQYAKYQVKSILGFLYYVKYKESNKTIFLLKSKRLIQNSLNLDNSSVKLRAATFFLTCLEYSQSIEICDTFLTFPPKYILSHAYLTDIWKKVRERLCMVNTTEEIENIMKAIYPVLNKPVELKLMPGNYDITQQNPVWIFVISQTYFSMIYT
jgi:hypothetical protein